MTLLCGLVLLTSGCVDPQAAQEPLQTVPFQQAQAERAVRAHLAADEQARRAILDPERRRLALLARLEPVLAGHLHETSGASPRRLDPEPLRPIALHHDGVDIRTRARWEFPSFEPWDGGSPNRQAIASSTCR